MYLSTVQIEADLLGFRDRAQSKYSVFKYPNYNPARDDRKVNCHIHCLVSFSDVSTELFSCMSWLEIFEICLL